MKLKFDHAAAALPDCGGTAGSTAGSAATGSEVPAVVPAASASASAAGRAAGGAAGGLAGGGLAATGGAPSSAGALPEQQFPILLLFHRLHGPV